MHFLNSGGRRPRKHPAHCGTRLLSPKQGVAFQVAFQSRFERGPIQRQPKATHFGNQSPREHRMHPSSSSGDCDPAERLLAAGIIQLSTGGRVTSAANSTGRALPGCSKPVCEILSNSGEDLGSIHVRVGPCSRTHSMKIGLYNPAKDRAAIESKSITTPTSVTWAILTQVPTGHSGPIELRRVLAMFPI